jgi:hypothetical protein
MLEKIVNFLNEYGFEIAWFTMGFMFSNLLVDITMENASGAFFDVIVILFMAWSVKENYDE